MTQSEEATALAFALALLEDGKCWSRRNFAEDKKGQYCGINERCAVKWCAIGAWLFVSKDQPSHGLSVFTNDKATTFKPVREMFMKAINELEQN